MSADLVSETAAKTARMISDTGRQARSVWVDVTDARAVGEALARTEQELGRIDVVVNNAGITIVGGVQELSSEQWDRELDINLKSVYLVSRAAWPALRAGGGCILSTASIAGLWAIPNDAAYCASKAALIMLTKCMALDGARDGIRVNCVCPGFVQTPMIDGYFSDQADPDAARAFATGLHPLGRLGDPVDIADAFVYLASDEARWVTGTALVVDGGLTSGIWSGEEARVD